MTTEQTPQWTPPKNWRWMVGMTAMEPDTALRGTVVRIRGDKLTLMAWRGYRKVSVHASRMMADFTDPATLGGMLALVRELWQDQGLCAHGKYTPTGWRWSIIGGKPHGSTFRRMAERRWDTETEALLAALEAAP